MEKGAKRIQVLHQIRNDVEEARAKKAQGKLSSAIELMDSVTAKLAVMFADENDVVAKELMQKRLESYQKYSNELKSELQSTVDAQPNEKLSFNSNVQKVYWSDIVGLNSLKNRLKNEITFRMRFPSAFEGLPPLHSLLMYGPPGTGKTFVASAICTESKAVLFSVTGGDILSKWQGESEKAVKSLFELARKSPSSVIFIDEIDGLLGARTDSDSGNTASLKTQFLIEMENNRVSNSRVLLVAATNLPWKIDDAALRRFQHRAYVPLPDDNDRMELFRKMLDSDKFSDSLAEFAASTDGYSASDIKDLLLAAKTIPFERAQAATNFTLDETTGKYRPCFTGSGVAMKFEDIPFDKLEKPEMTSNDVMIAIERFKPASGECSVNRYDEWRKDRGTDLASEF